MRRRFHWAWVCCLLSDQSACFIPAWPPSALINHLLWSDEIISSSDVSVLLTRQKRRYTRCFLEMFAYCVEYNRRVVDVTSNIMHNNIILDELWSMGDAKTVTESVLAIRNCNTSLFWGANRPKRGLKDSGIIYCNKILTLSVLVTMWKTLRLWTQYLLTVSCVQNDKSRRSSIQ